MIFSLFLIIWLILWLKQFYQNIFSKNVKINGYFNKKFNIVNIQNNIKQMQLINRTSSNLSVLLSIIRIDSNYKKLINY